MVRWGDGVLSSGGWSLDGTSRPSSIAAEAVTYSRGVCFLGALMIAIAICWAKVTKGPSLVIADASLSHEAFAPKRQSSYNLLTA